MKKKIVSLSLAAILSLQATTFCFAEEYPDQNRQDEKISFIQKNIDLNTVSPYAIQDQYSPYQLFAGSVIPAVLVTGINSDLPNMIVGQVSQDIYDTVTGQYLLIPQGTKIIGQYDSQTTYGQERLLVVWNRLIFPNGKSILIGNMSGSDVSGMAGFHDKVNSHYGKVLWSAFLGGAISAGVAATSTKGAEQDSYQATAGAEAAKNFSQATQTIVQKNLNIQPTLIIRTGYQFNVLLSKDLILEPYHE